MDETADAMDRISDLPTFIIHHIMSYLYPEDVARTSLLSKRWNQIRTTFPILDFSYPKLLVPTGLNDQNLNVWKEKLLRNEDFDIFISPQLRFRTKIFPSIVFLDAALLRFRELKLAIQMLTVAVRLMDVEGSSSLVDKWIGLAVENGVKELHFEVESSPRQTYTLPQTIYSAKLLTTLELTGCRLEEPLNAISLNSLKELNLRGVYVNEQMVHKLIGECHLLEDLCLSGCLGLKFLSVSKEHKLKNLTIDAPPWPSKHCELERVVAPSLQQLNFHSCHEKITVACPDLKKLVLVWVMHLTDEEFYQLISKFPLLEDLSVTRCHTPERIKISSDRLKHLLFQGCDNLKAIDIEAPNLLSFTFGSTSINSIPTLSRNTQCPWIVDIGELRRRGNIDTLWFLRLKEFLGASKQIENLFISIPMCKYDSRKVEFNFEKARKHSPSLPIQVGDMELEAKVPKAAGYKMLLDGLFWTCYPKTLRLHATIGTSRLLFVAWLLKWLLKKPWNNRNVKCCKSSPIKCWKHDLKEIKIVSFLPWNLGGEPMKAHNLMDMLQEKNFTLPRGYYTLKLEWRVPVLHDTT